MLEARQQSEHDKWSFRNAAATKEKEEREKKGREQRRDSKQPFPSDGTTTAPAKQGLTHSMGQKLQEKLTKEQDSAALAATQTGTQGEVTGG